MCAGALDAESEAEVQAALAKAMVGRTVLIIAHRLSTIAAADIIYVMDRGRVVETGSHQELLERDGRYAHLVKRQRESGGMEADFDALEADAARAN